MLALDKFVRGYNFVLGYDLIPAYDLVCGHRIQLHLWMLIPTMVLEEAVSPDLLSNLVQLAFLGWIWSCSGGVLASCASRLSLSRVTWIARCWVGRFVWVSVVVGGLCK